MWTRLILACAACSAPHATTPAVPGATYDAYVIDATGLASGARVDVVKLAPHACPCAPLTPDEQANERPACSCPAAIPMWRDALDHCTRPAALTSVTADEHGHVVVPAIAGTTLVATGAHGEAWIAAPALQAPIALQLVSPQLRATIAARPEGLHAAVITNSGHCVPLHRDGDAWIPDGVLDNDDSRVVVAANAEGFGVDTLSAGSTTAELAIFPARAASGECPADTVAHLDSMFQHATARVGATGAYTFPHVLGFRATVTCVDSTGAVLDEASYDPQSGEIEGTIATTTSSSDEECIPVDVVDQSGRAVADATLSSMLMSGNFGSGTGGATDAHGHGCTTEEANELHVDAPMLLGGQCAGHEELTLAHTGAPQQAHTHIPVTLHVRELPRVAWSGRVVTPEHVPVAGAYVTVDVIAPADTPDCYERSNTITITTALDGTFTLPALPRGRITLDIEHRWYVKTHFETLTTGVSRDIVVGRGATWAGRMLDPDGHPIDACTIFVTEPDQRLQIIECAHGTFAMSVLPAGESTIEVRLHHHALGDARSYVYAVTIARDEHRVADIRWPTGATIAGTVVDAAGLPVPHARVDALPKGAAKLHARISDDEIVVVADAAGHFAFRHITPGVWAIGVGQRSVDVATGTLDARITTK